MDTQTSFHQLRPHLCEVTLHPHTGEHHHRDSEEPSSHITQCILYTARTFVTKLLSFEISISLWEVELNHCLCNPKCLAKKTWTFNLFQFLHLNFTTFNFWTSQVFHFLKTPQLAKLLASLVATWPQILTLNLIHSEELFHHKVVGTIHSGFISLFH